MSNRLDLFNRANSFFKFLPYFIFIIYGISRGWHQVVFKARKCTGFVKLDFYEVSQRIPTDANAGVTNGYLKKISI
jgi:hypothetical protein